MRAAPEPRRGRRVWAAGAAAALVAGCAGAERQQSMTDPAGANAQAVDVHWQTMLVLGCAVWVIVAVAIVIALARRRKTSGGDRATLFVTLSGAVVPALIILVVVVQATAVQQEINPRDAPEDATVIEVIGHRYWWEVRYPEQDVVTANEIHIPVGEQVRVQVDSEDVIHSVWVPSLSGKVDMIPGRSNTMWLETEEPGTYWGACAEFCGLQHANMRFVVVAHEAQEFEGWVAAQQRPEQSIAAEDPAVATEQDRDLVAEGRQVFMSSSCVYCHTVAGTAATGDVGPDLTHLASRDTLAAGILPNNRGNLAAWLVDPQSIKPGNLMPGTDLEGEELQALLAYLESLE